MNKAAGPDNRNAATLNYLCGNNDLEKSGGKHIGATSGQSDRPVRTNPGVAGQLATAGGLPTWFLHQQVPGSHDTRHTCCQDAVIPHTHTHTLAFDPIQVKVWDLVSGLHADATPELTICPFGRTPDLLRLPWASLISSLARCHKRRCHLTASKCKHLKWFCELSWQLKSLNTVQRQQVHQKDFNL